MDGVDLFMMTPPVTWIPRDRYYMGNLAEMANQRFSARRDTRRLLYHPCCSRISSSLLCWKISSLPRLAFGWYTESRTNFCLVPMPPFHLRPFIPLILCPYPIPTTFLLH